MNQVRPLCFTMAWKSRRSEFASMLPTADEIVLSGLVATRMKDLKIDDEDWCWVEGRIWFTDERDLLLYSLKYSRDDIMYNMINDMVDSLSN